MLKRCLILALLALPLWGQGVTYGPACVPCYVITSPLPGAVPLGSIIVTLDPNRGVITFDCSYLHALPGYGSVACPQTIVLPQAPISEVWGGNAWQSCNSPNAPVQGCWWGFSFWSQ